MTVTIEEKPARQITIRDGFAWAHIFLREGVGECSDGSPRYWATIAVNSDYGSFGYTWSHMGEPTSAFVADLDFSYAMQKFLGDRFHVPMESEDCCDKVRAIVLERRRHDGMTKEDARSLWNETGPDADFFGFDFLRELDERTGGAMYRNELWDSRWTEPCPQARGFWRDIWPHFVAHLQQGERRAARARATTPA